MLAGVGFFHFVQNRWNDPLGSLETALKQCDSLRNRLIVLPEAFNVGADYSKRAFPTIPALTALKRLAEFSAKYEIVFVAGLLHMLDEYNSAYLIDANLKEHPWRLLCHKLCTDGLGKYQPCLTNPINFSNPAHCRGVYVGSLICMDVNNSRAMEERLQECSGHALLCIPAWMDAKFAPNEYVSLCSTPGPHWVLANSNPSGCGSFITNRHGQKVAQIRPNTEASTRNALIVKSWAELGDANQTASAQ